LLGPFRGTLDSGDEAAAGRFFIEVRRHWSQSEQIKAVIAMVVTTLAFVYFIFFLSDPITEWLLKALGLSD
jgi:preprotein translocase subunit SecE